MLESVLVFLSCRLERLLSCRREALRPYANSKVQQKIKESQITIQPTKKVAQGESIPYQECIQSQIDG